MDVYLLGNGFDLYHRLPTKYNNFLHSIDFLVNHYEKSMNTVGKVFGDARLQKCDSWIRLCYDTHKGIFDATSIEPAIISGLIDHAEDNMWFRYLMNVYNRDVGWIDFEKEVSKVIDAFGAFFDEYKFTGSPRDVDQAFARMHLSHKYIVEQFPFFLDWREATSLYDKSFYAMDQEWLEEEPVNSGYYELNTDLIAKTLFESLMELGEMLRQYLKYFVENAAYLLFNTGLIDYSPFSSVSSVQAITFNYTNLYEKLCRPQDEVCHIHGSLDTSIVLGINPTAEDVSDNVNTTFLRFKKYYQRVLTKSDTDYLEKIALIRGWKEKKWLVRLTIFGHSLDKTDEDVIRECFDLSNDIIIYYYEPDFHATIRNLIAIFGKQEFDRLRREKNMRFKRQPVIDWAVYKAIVPCLVPPSV